MPIEKLYRPPGCLLQFASARMNMHTDSLCHILGQDLWNIDLRRDNALQRSCKIKQCHAHFPYNNDLRCMDWIICLSVMLIALLKTSHVGQHVVVKVKWMLFTNAFQVSNSSNKIKMKDNLQYSIGPTYITSCEWHNVVKAFPSTWHNVVKAKPMRSPLA